MPKERWSIKTAQADLGDLGDTAADVADPSETPEVGQPFPPDFGVNLGTMIILNHLRDQTMRLATNYGLSPAQLKPAVDAVLAIYQKNLKTGLFLNILRQGGGNPDLLKPDQGTIEGIFQTILDNNEFNPAEVKKQQQIAMEYLPAPTTGALDTGGRGNGNMAWKTIGKQVDAAIKQRIQQMKATIPNQAVQQFAPQLAPYNASKKSRTIAAQVEQAQQGPLSVGRYESIDQLKADLIAMGPKPETYEKIMSMVGPQNEDSVKEAVASFYQGMAASLSTIYDMLVGVGMANPIDADVVEQLQTQHPELNPNQPKQQSDRPHVNKPEEMAMAENEKTPKFAGLYLPAINSGLNTKSDQLSKQAATSAYPAYESHGPGENRFCPKIRKDVNTFICRNHCLDGLIVDDHQVLCGEAIWRQSVMDKFSVEYRDKDGNWTGGYLEKRFEIHHDDGGHPALLKPGQRHAPIHEDAWSLEKRMVEMRKSQGGSRGYNTPKDSEDLYNFDNHDLMKGPKNPQAFEKKKDNIAKLAITVADTLLDKSAQNNNLPPDQGGLDDFMTQQHSDEMIPPEVEAQDQMPREVTIDGYAEKFDRTTGDWETVIVSHLKGTFKGIQKIDIGRMAIVEGSDGNTYAVTPQTLNSPAPEAPPAGPSPDADAPWVTGASSFAPFNRAAKKKKKKSGPAAWVPYHIWVNQKDEDDDDDSDDSDDSEGSESLDGGMSLDGGGDGGGMGSSTAAGKWSITKQAWGLHAPSAPKNDFGSDTNNSMGENVNHGRVAKKCQKCGKICAGNAQICDNPNCRCPNLSNYNQSDAESASGAINNNGLIPIASLDAEVHFANGVYKATKGSKSGYGENPQEALEKLAQSLQHLKPRTIEEEGSQIMDARQQNSVGLQENDPLMPNPMQVETENGFDPTPSTEGTPPVMDETIPPPEISMDPTPSTEGIPAEDASAVPVEIGPNSEGQTVSEFIPEFSGEPHISTDELDSHLASENVNRHPRDRVEVEQQAINSGAHPD